MIVTTYNQHVPLLSSDPFGWFAPPKFTRAWETTLLWNQCTHRYGIVTLIGDFCSNVWIVCCMASIKASTDVEDQNPPLTDFGQGCAVPFPILISAVISLHERP